MEKSQTLGRQNRVLFSCIPNSNRDSLAHTRRFSDIQLSVFKYRLTKNDFSGQKVSGAFAEQAPGAITLDPLRFRTFGGRVRLEKGLLLEDVRSLFFRYLLGRQETSHHHKRLA